MLDRTVGELAVEEAVDLSQDRIHDDDDGGGGGGGGD